MQKMQKQPFLMQKHLNTDAKTCRIMQKHLVLMQNYVKALLIDAKICKIMQKHLFLMRKHLSTDAK